MTLAFLAQGGSLSPARPPGPEAGLAADGRTYYVSLSGDDSHDGLAPARAKGSRGPFRTFRRAAGAVRAGDTVLIRGGTYVGYGGSWGYSFDGTEAKPIAVAAYPGETVVIDGAGHTLPPERYTPLMQVYGDWYRISRIELRHGSYAGLNVVGDHCVVEDVTCHHNRGTGIVISGDHCTAARCRTYGNSLANEHAVMPIGWYGGMTLTAGARHSTIRECASWHNWGEGLKIASGYHCAIEDCVSYDNFNVNIYVSHSFGGVCQRNLSYFTPGNPLQAYSSSQNAIYAGDENRSPDSSGNRIVNNLCLGGDRCLLVRGDDFENALIAHNTFVNAFGRRDWQDAACVYFLAGASAGGRFVNNIVSQDGGVPISHLEAEGVAFENNNWSRAPLPGCRGPGDVIGDPKLLKTGPADPGALTPEWFRISFISPARDRAVPLEGIREDAVKRVRAGRADIGAIEAPDRPRTSRPSV